MSAPDPTPRVLVTGAGGAAAIGLLRLAARPDVDLYAADIDPTAAGLYMVPATRRVLVPPGRAPEFVDAMLEVCRAYGITVLIPTVDDELLPLAQAVDQFQAQGVTVVTSPASAIATCLDKAVLTEVCQAAGCPVPTTVVLEADTSVSLPVVTKPRRGSGARGVRLIRTEDELAEVPRDGSYIACEFLPGDELSVDVFVRADGHVSAAVPRSRDRVDSGVSIAGRTLLDPHAIEVATKIARACGVRGVANIQLRRRVDGKLALIEVNPRVSGSLALTAAAGANLAGRLVAEALGEPIADQIPFREVAAVRYLVERIIDIDEYRTGSPKAEVFA